MQRGKKDDEAHIIDRWHSALMSKDRCQRNLDVTIGCNEVALRIGATVDDNESYFRHKLKEVNQRVEKWQNHRTAKRYAEKIRD